MPAPIFPYEKHHLRHGLADIEQELSQLVHGGCVAAGGMPQVQSEAGGAGGQGQEEEVGGGDHMAAGEDVQGGQGVVGEQLPLQ